MTYDNDLSFIELSKTNRETVFLCVIFLLILVARFKNFYVEMFHISYVEVSYNLNMTYIYIY